MPSGRNRDGRHTSDDPDNDPGFVVESGEWNNKNRVYRAGVIIVGFIPASPAEADVKVKANEIVNSVKGTLEYLSVKHHWLTVKIDAKDGHVQNDAMQLQHRDDVEYAEPDFIIERTGPVASVAEEDMWWIGDINAEKAWCIEEGKSHVLIGILDTGIVLDATKTAVDHVDLEADRFTLGANHYDSPSDTESIPPYDASGHGTNVAGIIAAWPGGSTGVKGMNRVSPVCVCKVSSNGYKVETGQTDTEGSIAALRVGFDYLLGQLESRADIARLVINTSVRVVPPNTGFPDFVELPFTDSDLRALDKLFRDTLSKDDRIILCSSAGNEGESNDYVQYPAGYAIEHGDRVIAVSAYKNGGDIDPTSSFGAHILVAAPSGVPTTRLPDTVSTDVYESSFPYTSSAAPFATGLVSLIWSHAPGLTQRDVVSCIKNSAVEPGLPSDTANDIFLRWGNGKIEAYAAIPDAKQVTERLVFLDVPSGSEVSKQISIEVKTPIDLEFWVDVDAGSSTGANVHGNRKTFHATAPFDEYHVFTHLSLTYHGTNPGNSASGVAHVRCAAFGDDWSIPVEFTANTSKGDSHIVLVADSSGSMGQSSGPGPNTRMDILKESSKLLVDHLAAESAMGIVAFSTDATVAEETTQIPQGSDGESKREDLRKAIDDLSPSALTSIGDGLELGENMVNAVVDDYDNSAMIVLTDGRETAEEYVNDVISGITSDVYAIGLGTPDAVDAETLTALASRYLLITGTLDAADEYKLSKYFMQILLDVNNSEVVLDPPRWVRPDRVSTVSFNLTDLDTSCTVSLLWPRLNIIQAAIEPPGDESSFDSPIAATSRGCIFRPDLSHVDQRAGTWNARLQLDTDEFNAYKRGLPQILRRRVDTHGVPVSLIVGAKSALRMRCSLSQSGFTPGSTVFLRAVLEEEGTPMRTAQVNVTVRQPDDVERVISLRRSFDGAYEVDFPANNRGLYECYFRASGETRGSQSFTREQVRTAFVGNTTRSGPSTGPIRLP